jgi:hypothetical protein
MRPGERDANNGYSQNDRGEEVKERQPPTGRRSPSYPMGEMMRQATLNLLDAATSDDQARPRVWAPFVVVGEPTKGQ